MAPFKKYDSIENAYREKHVSRCFHAISSGRCDDDFVVEEKAHGANFSFYCDGVELRTACRNSLLEGEGEKFSKSHLLKRKYAKRIVELHSLVLAGLEDDNEKKTTIRIVGEMIGGCYRHPNVEEEDGASRIQKGVEYCPGHEFYAFDLSFLAENGDGTDDDEANYVTMDKLEANRLFEEAGMLYARPLYRGTLEECLKYDNEFKSHIPGWLGLPEHPEANIAEGKVIKPVKFATVCSGTRLILKDKPDCFSEVAYGYERTQKPKIATRPRPKLTEDGADLLAILEGHVTENRLQNVLSKLPRECTAEDCGLVCGLLSKDALEEFRKDFGDSFDALGKKEQKTIKKCFAIDVGVLVQSALTRE